MGDYKYCCNCAFSIVNAIGRLSCAGPHLKINLVTGYGCVTDCNDERYMAGELKCGEEGKYFQLKESK